MGEIAFALKVQPGGSDKIQQLTKDLKEKAGFHDTRKSHGVEKVRVFHQTHPEEMVVVYLETSGDTHGAFRNQAGSSHEFDSWFMSAVEDITGHHLGKTSSAPSKEIMHWDAREGHKV